jgi:hypothetical protein
VPRTDSERDAEPVMSENSACAILRGSVVVTEESTKPLPPMNGTTGALRWRTIKQLVAEALVVPFAVVVRHELGERPTKMPFA